MTYYLVVQALGASVGSGGLRQSSEKEKKSNPLPISMEEVSSYSKRSIEIANGGIANRVKSGIQRFMTMLLYCHV